jgi:tripartite-type tricarboxylate transporter receptor subunit TctC
VAAYSNQKFRSKASVVLLGFMLVLIPLATHAADEPFFAGKMLTILVGFSPGGGVDTNARLVARHLARQIPGRPKVIVKNMPGAGGLLLANHLYHRAKPSGLEIGFPGRSYPLAPLLGDPGAKFDGTNFSFVGTVSQTVQALFVRSALGIRNLNELKKSKKQIVMPGLSNRSSNVMVPRILHKYLGWPLKSVSGYPATARTFLALETGEGDGIFANIESIKGVRPELLANGFLVPIVQTDSFFPGVPLLDDQLTTKNVKRLLNLVRAPALWGVPLIGPPGIPEDRLAVLRSAFIKMTRQERFKKDAERVGLEVRPLNGEQLSALVKNVLDQVDPKVVEEYETIMKSN